MPTSVTAETAITLPNILPGSYVLPYAIPLLLLSIKVNFLGTFLTLDRTRTFAPIEKTPIFNDRQPWWRLEGGFGGLAGGWLCGLHLTTYLSLLILNKSNLSLSGLQFLVIWILVSALFAFLGGRWRIAASIFFALVASASFCSLINIIFLPHTLLPRLIIYAVFTPLLIVGTLIPHQVIRHSTLRTCTALTGSGGIVISIALFTKVPSWSSPWLTLAIAPYVGNRDSHEKGLSAALCVLAVAGAAVDWLCKFKLGENPDKEWDAYLAKYSRSLPFSSDRAGSFQPYQSFWARLFSGNLFKKRSASDRDILFPPDSQLLPTSAKQHTGEELEKTFTGTAPPSFRPYPFTASRKTTLLAKKGKTRSPLKGGAVSDSSDSDSSDDDAKGPPKFKPWVMKRASTANSAATTLVPSTPGEIGGLAPPPKFKPNGGVEDYSDVEVGVTSAAAKMAKEEKEKEKERNSPGWKPGFIKKHEEEVQRRASLKGKEQDEGSVGSTAPLRLTESPTPLSRNASSSASRGPAHSSRQQSRLAPPTPDSLPVTPSLIRAYDRINRARQDSMVSSSPTTPNANPGAPSRFQTPQIDGSATASAGTGSPTLAIDDGFWEHLRAKAGEFKSIGQPHTPRR
ncbi:hypothetical protein M407DRAFT_24943 [Tulasnella calospora MUT 4182]|uniref:DUF4203 domain-containing protein n=1 Tax=Tulasnella calospora MUT 4182 TaxID=1051891 RepID=A0A0C3KW18_9AGAM|nr:hypothetical protein M407DRAFT_24943 [Tulasnella calospora MUT 4182]